MNKKSKIVMTVAAFLVLAALVVVPKVFAQGKKETQETVVSDTDPRIYGEWLNYIFNYVYNNYVDEVDPKILYQGALKGMLDAFGDIHTTYLDSSLQRTMNDTVNGSFGGVGLQISKLSTSTPDDPAYVLVSAPIAGTPGWYAGIQSGDLLIEIDGTDTSEITMDDVLDILRGEIGTTVEVKVRRGTMEFTVVMERALIEITTVTYGMVEEGPGRTGYLRIHDFTPLTATRVQDAIDYFKEQKADSMILDLRGNGGGLLTAAEAVADKFIDEGVVVSTKGRGGVVKSVYNASKKNTTVPSGMPVVVLIDSSSASASEILAGALKDHKVAYLVGENSYGKGSVQQAVGLNFNDGFKFTIERYYSPSDSNIDKVGIPPDLEVLYPELTEEEQASYVKLLNDNILYPYTKEHPGMTEAEIAAYADKLVDEYPMDILLLRRIIRTYANRTRENPLYDYEYDIQLKAALEIVNRSDFKTLVNSVKTLKEIELEREATEASETE